MVLFALLVSQNTFAQNSTDTIFLTEEEQVWIAEHSVITASSNMALAPFDFISAGQPAGLSIDYLNLIGTKVGLKIDYVNFDTWAEMMEGAKNNKIDIIHSISINEERAKYLSFSTPYYNIPTVNFGRVGSQKINSSSDLEGKRIGILRGHIIGETYKEKYPHFDLIEFNSHSEIIRALALDKIDIYTAGATSIEFLISQNNIHGLEIIGNDFVLENNVMNERIAIHKDNPTLMAIINKAIANITNEELIEIIEKWIKASSVNYDIGLTTEEKIWLSQNRVIQVGIDPTVAPIETIEENGKISGIAGDYLDVIGKKLNIKFEWAGSRNWSEALSMVQNGEADMLSSAVSTPSRREYLLFTEKYTFNPNVIFTRSGEQIFGNLDSLSGYKIAQVRNFAVNEYIGLNYPDIEIVEVLTSSEAIKKVSSGEVEAFISNIPRGVAAITREGITNIIVSGDASDYNGGNSMATHMDLPLLASSLQKALASISTVQREEITRRWLSVQVAAAPDYELLRLLGLVAITIIVAITIWAVSAQIEIRRRRVVENKLILSQEVAAEAKNEAEMANAAKSTFLANMSHEIRTPLNAIIGFSDAMIMGIGGPVVSPKHKDYLIDIKSSGEHLAEVIKDILDLSKIEAGKWRLNKKDFSLDKCIEESIKIMNIEADQKNIKLFYEGDNSVIFYGDEYALKRVFINLLSNAIKFTDNEGSVRCVLSELNNTQIKIEIIDYGIGIEKERINQVLIPFEQGREGHELNDEGTGLGLPIVNELVKLHGGIFTLKSEVNVETRATILLPKLGRENQ